ncbi:YafY family protein [Paenibacillus sp. J2TS4]|uniref:helix-turn-helix transcriptional regulator n=1 Tax=Paenibacillus sp. J2TS4 TaxID=2807194 RepID=UPI001AFE4EE6|nr:YafY family protein [Paenibacillus sp. J2TS4]GIP32810.1 DeoR family transcriptional regulator [Paenibacillus sp. J2TS4]
MKLIRALGITMELLSKRRVTAAELADRFEVSNRTIYRDIELISQAGIPVASYTGTDGGFEVMSGFYLTKQHFSLEDLSVIYNLLRGMEGAMGAKPVSIMGKLSSLQPALLNGGNVNKIIFDMSTSELEKNLVHPLLQAINDKRVVSFSYISSTGSNTDRSVEPAALYWGRGAWYLSGYCLLRQASRMFRLSRLSSLKITDDKYQPREEAPASDAEEVQGMQAHLRFDLSAQPRVLEQFPGECIRADDHIDVHTVFYKTEYAVSVVLSYGPKVTIISPDELKHQVLNTMLEIQKLYHVEEK